MFRRGKLLLDQRFRQGLAVLLYRVRGRGVQTKVSHDLIDPGFVVGIQVDGKPAQAAKRLPAKEAGESTAAWLLCHARI